VTLPNSDHHLAPRVICLLHHLVDSCRGGMGLVVSTGGLEWTAPQSRTAWSNRQYRIEESGHSGCCKQP
jgi:hypothetical protein